MRSRHSVEEKFEIVMEALTENTTQAEICRRHKIFLTQFVKWKEHLVGSGKKGRSRVMYITITIADRAPL